MESLRGWLGLGCVGNSKSLPQPARGVGLSVGDSNTVLSCAVGSGDNKFPDSEQAMKVAPIEIRTHVSLFGLLAIA
jgi:hypothetical protein